MQKVTRHFLAIAGRILFIGFSVQILLGLVWACCNIGRLEGSFACVQLLVLVFAFCANSFLVKTVTETNKIFCIVWGSMALLTVPMSLQCHVLHKKESVIGSFLVYQLAFLWRRVKKLCEQESKEEYRYLAVLGLFWLLEAVIAPEYRYLGAVPVILLFLYEVGKGFKKKSQNSKVILYQLLLVCAFGGMIWGVNQLQTKEDAVSVRYEVASMLFQRCGWSTIIRDWTIWPDELTNATDGDLLLSASYYTDKMEEELLPDILKNLGEKEASSLYLSIAKDAVVQFPKTVLRETGWDALAYSVPPVGTLLFLEGRGYESYTPRNYDWMRQETPKLSMYYMDYGCKWFGAALFLGALIQGMVWLFRKERIRKQKQSVSAKYEIFSVGISAIFIIGYYTLRGAGMMDYKQVIAICSLWGVWMVRMCMAALKDGE